MKVDSQKKNPLSSRIFSEYYNDCLCQELNTKDKTAKNAYNVVNVLQKSMHCLITLLNYQT